MKLRIAADGAFERLGEAAPFAAAPGNEVEVVHVPLLDAFRRADEWDAAEVSLAKYCALRSAGDDRFGAVPVFPLARPCHPMIYVRRGIRRPGDLAGRRVGLADWSNTAAVYARGLLAHEFGLDLRAVRWVQAGLNEPRKSEFMTMPEGYPCEVVVDRSLSEMLAAGDIDAVISPRRPACMSDGSGDVVLLFDEVTADELRRAEAHPLPVLHTFAFRSDVKSTFPGLADRLARFLSAASRRFGKAHDGPWPQGLEQTRKALEAFLAYADELGVTRGRLSPAQLFEGG